MKKPALISFFVVLLTVAVVAQFGGGRRRGRGWGGDSDIPRTAREIGQHDTETPTWTNPEAHAKDVFTFTRIVYERGGTRGWGGFGRGDWRTDVPDSDLNLSYRLQQMTSMKVDPDGRIIRLTDKELANYPFIYIVEPGGLEFTEEEIPALRAYLLNGGFLMFDDFWGDSAWENVEEQMKRVFQDREFVELPLNEPGKPDHPIYHCVFDIKEKGQVPNMETGDNSQYNGVTWEDRHDGDVRTVHHRGISDDKGRLMVIACHNTDNGDGWEREGYSDYYFHNFSEKIAYPLGVNIIFYAMTH